MGNKTLLAVCLLCAAISAAESGPVSAANNCRYVNLFLGSAGDHGQVSPAAQVPFGLVSICPDSKVADRHAGYDYEVPEIHGISVTRINGVGGNGCGGNLRALPASKGEELAIVKGSEEASPGFYSAVLSNGVRFKCTAGRNVAVEQFVFARGKGAQMSIDFNSAIDGRRSECEWEVIDSKSVRGWVQSSTTCNFGAYRLYFELRFDKAWDASEREGDRLYLTFPDKAGKLEMRIALSPVSVEDAVAQGAKMQRRSFRSIRREASKAWAKILGKIDVRGGSEEQKVLLYTSLYRVFLTPYDALALDRTYMGTDRKTYSAPDWTYYSGWSMWDTYRTKFPLITLLDPDAMSDICRSLASLYRTGKQNWANALECTPTVRTEHSQLLMLDCWMKGIRGFDFAEAFPGMMDEYKHRLTRKSPDQKVETIYDIWALGRIAEVIANQIEQGSEAVDDSTAAKMKIKAMHYREAADMLKAEADAMFEQVWPVEFKDITDRFALMKGNGMYQGTRWQYRWALPVYADRMIEMVGADSLSAQLSKFFELNLFNQGNEPDIQTPFMFGLFGSPELSDNIVHRLLTDETMVHIYGGNAEYPEPFVGRAFRNALDGYAPEMDEDDGAMSAWYIFAQLGLYPLCMGTDKYEMFTPLFERSVIHLESGDLIIERRGPEGKAHRVTLDGEELDSRTVSHSKLLNTKRIIWY